MFRWARELILTAAVMAAVGTHLSFADNAYQGFETWLPRGMYTNGPNTNQGWVVNDVYIAGGGGFFANTNVTPTSTNASFLLPRGTGTFKSTNSWITTPWLSNGVGTISFWHRTTVTPSTNYFEIQRSYDGTNWGFVTNGESSLRLTWTATTNSLNIYTNIVLRIFKTGDLGSNPYLGIDDLAVTNPPARVLISDTGTKQPPEVLKPIDVECTLNPSSLASNISATCYWHVAATSWQGIPMTTNAQGKWQTATSIPPQSTEDTLSYFVRVWFQGNDPISPTNDPPGGSNSPIVIAIAPRTFSTGYDSFSVTGSFSTAMYLFRDYAWQGVASTTTVGGVFGFAGVTTNTAVTNRFGDANQNDFSLPIPGFAETNAAAIQVPGTSSGQFLFRIDETNLEYSARQCLYQNFDTWNEGTYTADTNSGWVVYNSQIAQNAISYLDPGGSPYRSCFMDTNGFSALRSPLLTNGIGEISVYYRSSVTNPAAVLTIQKSYTGGTNASEWVTIANQPGIVNTNYTRRSFFFNDRYCNYVRILSSTNPPSGMLCLDEVIMAYAGAGVWFTNVVVSPSPPIYTDPVTLSCDVLPRAGASNLVVTAWYRSGTSGTFTAIGMTNAGNTFVTTNLIPAGMGDLGSGVGTVQYYFTCSFSGYESEYANMPVKYPEGGSNNATSFAVIPAQVAFSNVITVLSPNNTSPDIPAVGSNIYIAADIIPFAGAEWVMARLYYRIGTSGAFTPIFMDQVGATNHYVSRTAIPAQSFSGTPVHYYIQAEFFGPMAMSPTNYPSAAPNNWLTFVFRTLSYPSAYTSLTVSGTFNTNLTLIGPCEWQGLVATNSTAGRPSYRFNAFFPSGSTNWGDVNQVQTNWPAYGVAEGGAANIVSSNASGYVLFRFNESNREYSIQQRCAYMNFDTWDTGVSGYTNGEWVIADGQTVTTPAYRSQGRSCVLSTNAGLQCVRSCYLTNGVGEVNFWYRNLQTNGAVAASFSLQTSVDGTNAWRTVTTVTNILTMDYLHYSYTLSDTNKHFVRILSETNTPRAGLCLDEIIIAPPGPGVIFTAVSNSPANPTISTDVTILSQILPTGGSTNISAWVWYRAATNAEYASTPMTNSGTSFLTSPPIPKGPVGNIQYYIESAYTGFRSGELVHVTYPDEGPYNPMSYSNNDTSLTLTFESWLPRGMYTNGPTTNGDQWVINDVYVAGGSGFFANTNVSPTSTNAGFLLPMGTGKFKSTNAWIQTPWFSNGVGTISFWHRTTVDPSINYFELQSSYDGTTWNFVTNGSSSSPRTTWTVSLNILNIYSNMTLRILKTGDVGTTPYLGIDDIAVSPPSATVEISDVMRHPYYPCTNESVYISCTITSSSPMAYAMNITARLYYRFGSGSFQGPIEMNRFGDDFITSQGIPPSVDKVPVEYYIESTFQGYHFNDSVSMSPTYAPSGVATGSMSQYYSPPTSGFFSYPIRTYASDYDNIQVAASVTDASASMLHTGDDSWQGVINFPSATASPWFSLQGFGYDTGHGPALTTNLWGDPGQSHSELPFAGYATFGATNFLLPGNTIGQYLIRFNENTRVYTIQRCVFQDFDLWQAPPDYFANSVNRIGIGTKNQGFDSWTPSVMRSTAQDWSRWPLSTTYRIDTYPYPWAREPWVANGGMIVTQLEANADMTNAFQFHPDPAAANAFVGPTEFWSVDGIGTFSLLYRCVDTSQPPTFNYMTTNYNSSLCQATVDITDFPTNAGGTMVGLWDFSMYFRYIDANNYYEFKVEQKVDNLNRRRGSLWRCRGGARQQLTSDQGYVDLGSARAEKATLTVWAYNYGVNTDLVEIVIGYNVPGSAQGWAWYDTDTGNNIRSPGAIGFRAKDADIKVDDIWGGGGQFQRFEKWSTSGYRTSSNGEWRAYNAWMASWDGWNSARLIGPNANANIRSGLLPQGVGSVFFNAQKDDIGPSPVLHLQSSTNGTTNASDWVELGAFNITPTSWNGFSTNLNITNAVYLRFLATTNSSGAATNLYLDDIYISPNSNAPTIFTNTFDTADSTNTWITPEGQWYWDANGSYNCRGYNGEPLSFEIHTAPNPKLAIPMTHSYPYDTEWNTTNGVRTGCTNTHYESASFTIESGADICIRVKHTAGYGSLVMDNLAVTSWRGAANSGSGWTAAESLVVTNGWRTNAVELLRSRSKPSGFYTNQYVVSPAFTNGIGLITFRSYSRDGTQVTCDLRIATSVNALLNPASTVLTITNSATSWSDAQAYTYYNASLPGTFTYYIMLMPTSTNLNAGLFVDDIRVSDFFSPDAFTWVAENALITGTPTNRLRQTEYDNIKGAYLNNHPTNDTVGPPIYTNGSYIQSSLLTNGIGEISFWYRAWDASPASVRIAAASGSSNASWVTLTNLYSITNTTYRQYTFMTYDTSNQYVRLYCNTSPAAPGRVCLDDLLITAPFGADVKLRNVTTSPPIPLDTNTVHFTVELYDFFSPMINGLFTPPLITNISAHYTVGTNPWATWAGGTAIPMTLQADYGTSQLYRTRYPIAATNPIDTVIQYYVDCSFSGLFSDKIGAKRNNSFTNPPWYAPRDYNKERDPSGKTSTPYYVVFSCLPQAVWINEFNYSLTGQDPPETNREYVELCGPAGTVLKDWRIELINTAGSMYDHCVISNSSQFPGAALPDDTNGLGFFVYGDPGVANVDQLFTNMSSSNIKQSGGIRLVRSMGAHEYKICYGASISGFTRITNSGGSYVTKTLGVLSSLFLTGTGHHYYEFSWDTGDDSMEWYTPGTVNFNQTLTGEQVLLYTSHGTLKSWIQTYFTGWDNEVADTNDWDHDGLATWQEYITGTVPNNSNSVFEILDIKNFGTSNRITFSGSDNSGVFSPFGMLRRTNLVTSAWGLIGSVNRSSTGTNFFFDAAPPSNTPVFYRPVASNSW